MTIINFYIINYIIRVHSSLQIRAVSFQHLKSLDLFTWLSSFIHRKNKLAFDLTILPLDPRSKCSSLLSHLSVTSILDLILSFIPMSIHTSVNDVVEEVVFYEHQIWVMVYQLGLRIRPLLEYALLCLVMHIFLKPWYLQATLCDYHLVVLPLNINFGPQISSEENPINCNSAYLNVCSLSRNTGDNQTMRIYLYSLVS